MRSSAEDENADLTLAGTFAFLRRLRKRQYPGPLVNGHGIGDDAVPPPYPPWRDTHALVPLPTVAVARQRRSVVREPTTTERLRVVLAESNPSCATLCIRRQQAATGRMVRPLGEPRELAAFKIERS